MSKFDEETLRELSWDNLRAVAKENGVRTAQKREKITKDLLQLTRPKMTHLAKLRGDKGTLKMEKIRRRTVGHVKTPPRPAASGRRTRASTARRASEPQAQPQSQTIDAPAHAPAPAAEASAAEGRAEAAKPEEELRPLERARALCRAEKEKRAKEEAARADLRAEAQPPSATFPSATFPSASTAAAGEPHVDEGATVPTHLRVATNEKENTPSESAAGKPDGDDKPHSEQTTFQFQFPRKRVLYPVGVPVPPDSPPKPRARTPGLPPRDQWPDEWLVGLLSPDPSNPRPVFSPPLKKPSDGPKEKEKDEAALSRDKPAKVEVQPLARAAERKAERTLGAEKEQVDDGGATDTELAEEEEVFEMTSMDNIRVALPEDEVQHDSIDVVRGADKIVRENKRKAEEEEEEEETTATVLERSPAKRRRTGFRGWLSKVF